MEHAGFSMIAPTMLTTGPRGDVPEDWPQYNFVAHMLGHAWFGGVGGYQDILYALAHPDDDQYAERLDWVGENYDPGKFDLKAVNKRLQSLR